MYDNIRIIILIITLNQTKYLVIMRHVNPILIVDERISFESGRNLKIWKHWYALIHIYLNATIFAHRQRSNLGKKCTYVSKYYLHNQVMQNIKFQQILRCKNKFWWKIQCLGNEKNLLALSCNHFLFFGIS